MRKILLLIITSLIYCSSNAFAAEQRDLGEIIITATRIGQNDYKIAGNVTVIDKEQIKASTAQTVPEILKEALGVFVYDKSTSKSSVVDIRGFGDGAKSNILFLVNDRKINSEDLSGADLTQIPLNAVERIEIIRGAGSVLYGDNAVGGVINIITKKGKGKMSGKVGAVYGSYDRQGSDLEISGETKDLSYYFLSQYFDERGYRQNSDVLSKDFNARLAYDIMEKVDIDLEIDRHEDTTDLPSGLDETELQTLGRRGATNEADFTNTKDMSYRLGFDIDPWDEQQDYGKASIDFTFRQRDVFESFSGYNADRDSDTFGILAKYVFDKELFSRNVNFVTGVDYYDVTSRIIGSGSNTDDIEISKNDMGIYGFAEYELLDDLYVNAGTRYINTKYIFDDMGNSSYSWASTDRWVSMVGARLEYGNGSVVHVSAQETYRLLLTDEYYSTWSGLNTSLNDQTGKQFEIGIKHNLNDKTTLSITPYYIIIDNEIFYNANTWQNENYDKTKRMGVEVGGEFDILDLVHADFLDKLKVFMNYTYQNPEFAEGAYDGNDIPLVPRNQASSGIVAGFWDHYSVSLIGRLVGSRYIINDLDNAMDKAKPYYVFDAKIAYKMDNFEVFLAINNLFDEQYSPYQIKKTATSRDYYPAPERNFNVGMNIKF